MSDLLRREADTLEATAFQLRAWAKPVLDAAKAMEESARRLKQASQPGPAQETPPPVPAA